MEWNGNGMERLWQTVILIFDFINGMEMEIPIISMEFPYEPTRHEPVQPW